MSDISPRRRLTGRVLLAGAALAVPLTASFSYAAVPPPPPAPAAPEAPAAPPAPPAPPAPAVPAAPGAEATHTVVWESDRGGKDGKQVTVIVKKVKPGEAPRVASDGKRTVTFTLSRDDPLTDEQRRQLEEMSKQWADQGQEWAHWGEEFGRKFGEEWAKEWQKNAQKWAKDAQKQVMKMQKEWKGKTPQAFAVAAPNGSADCDGPINNAVVTKSDDGKSEMRTVVLCRQFAHETARRALEHARASIAHDRSLSVETRNEVLDSLDHELERLDRDSNSDD